VGVPRTCEFQRESESGATGIVGQGSGERADSNDSLFADTLDIDAFLSEFAGGPCLL
jgi:hypothetical protein